jgi:CRP-like cAMP-binding protein
MAGLSEEVSNKLVEGGMRVHFEPGEYFYRPGDPPGGIYGIVSGAVRVEITTSETTSQLIGCFQAGAWTGQAPSLDGSGRTMGFAAIGSVEALHLPLTKIKALAQQDQRIAEAIGSLSVWNLNLALRAVGELTIRRADRRIATRLLGVANYPFGIRGREGWEIPINQSEIAEVACCSRHNVNKVIGEFKREGWVSKIGSRLVITQPEAIKNFAGVSVDQE